MSYEDMRREARFLADLAMEAARARPPIPWDLAATQMRRELLAWRRFQRELEQMEEFVRLPIGARP